MTHKKSPVFHCTNGGYFVRVDSAYEVLFVICYTLYAKDQPLTSLSLISNL